MKLSKQIRKDLRTVLDHSRADLSPIWHLSMASMLEAIAADIRLQAAAKPPLDTSAVKAAGF